ncbi:MAG: type IV secretion system DNA-binding domain-containing protein [candidate division WOR-3 bacterium]
MFNSKYIVYKKPNSFFAFKLTSIQIFQIKNFESDVIQKIYDNLEKHKNFIKSLNTSPFTNATYEIRYISKKIDNGLFRNIDVYFICQINTSNEEAQKYFSTIYHLLNYGFDEYKFDIVDKNELEKLIGQKYLPNVYSITRRVILDELNTLKSGISKTTFGFNFPNYEKQLDEIRLKEKNSIVYLFPFVFSNHKGENFFYDLAENSLSDFNIRIKLKPYKLLEIEEKFFEEQIIKCEKFSQISIQSIEEDFDKIYPTLKNIAQKYQENILKFLLELKKNSALMTIEIESQEPLPEQFLNRIASYFSSYKTETSNDAHFYGGYEITDISKLIPSIIDPLEPIKLNLFDHPLIHKEKSKILFCFNSEEAACAFRFPAPPSELIPNFNLKLFRDRLAPIELIESSKQTKKSCLIGVNYFKNLKNEIRINYSDLRKHAYIVGQTGTGKTTLITTMVLDAIRNGKGVCLIDPHGDLFNQVLGKIPDDRIDDVVLFDPNDTNFPIAFNFLECENDEQRYFIVNEFAGIIKRLLESEYGYGALKDYTGPLFFRYLRNIVLIVLKQYNRKGTLVDVYNVLSSDDEFDDWSSNVIPDDPILNKFIEEVSQRDLTKPGSENISIGEYISSKLQNFVFDPKLRQIFSQPNSTIDFLKIMNEGKILLINLAKGLLTEENSRFLGMLIMTKIMSSAMERVKIPESERKDFYLFVDEFQSISTTSFTTLLSEARKFGLSLILANQFVQQITDEKIIQSIFGNVGTFICFRLGQVDANILEQKFLPYVSSQDLVNLPNWHAYVTTLVNEKNTIPFIIQTLLDPTPFSEETKQKVIEASREKYAKNEDDQNSKNQLYSEDYQPGLPTYWPEEEDDPNPQKNDEENKKKKKRRGGKGGNIKK